MGNGKNNQWLKRIADGFEMPITKFADVVGYSRQTLYCAAYGNIKLKKSHLGLAVFKLITLNDRMMNLDIQSAKERHAYRRTLIDEFAKRFGVEDE